MLSLVYGVAGCAGHVRPVSPDQAVSMHGHSLRLHFANADPSAADHPGGPLIVFATGDGGMHRKDLDAYRHLVALGYPIVGFDAHDYVRHLDTDTGTTPARLAADYQQIIDTARRALHLGPEHPVVLVGISRGAGLSVVAAGQRALHRSVIGVIAVALTQEEEYVHWYRRLRGRDGANLRPGHRVVVDVYEYLPRLGDIPIAVIQSTHDNYLTAAGARALFGPDNARRWLQAIDARNHSFKGARSRLYDAIRTALMWVLRPRPAGQ